MKEQFYHTATNSFLLWFDHLLLSKGEAFTNRTGKFYNYSDPRLGGGYSAFGSPFKQWVNDSSISGTSIPSGVFVNGSFTPRSSNLRLDFTNGRVLTKNIATSSTITGSFAVKDFNIYYTNETEDDLLINQQFKPNPRVYSPSEAYVSPYDPAVPAIFVSCSSMTNDPFAFGGMDSSTLSMNALVLADNPYQLEGVLSLFADAKNLNVPVITMSNHPSNEWGDLKSGTYSYNDWVSAHGDSANPLHIDDVTTSKLTDKAKKSINTNLFVGFIDFELKSERYPRL